MKPGKNSQISVFKKNKQAQVQQQSSSVFYQNDDFLELEQTETKKLSFWEVCRNRPLIVVFPEPLSPVNHKIKPFSIFYCFVSVVDC